MCGDDVQILSMSIVFRADASVQIGTGHVMRCLTLADALQSAGHVCRFICRAHAGHLAELIGRRGFPLVLLSEPDIGLPRYSDDVAHAAWLGKPWRIDAQETIAALNGLKTDCLVVDHYAIDHRWHKVLRSFADKILVIDDLADRRLDCDLLLNQNHGVTESQYRNLLSPACRLLLGAKYALLRPEFSALRPQAIEKRKNHRGIERILVSMGGTDADNVTTMVLDALQNLDWQITPSVYVVLGSQAPHLAAVVESAKRHPLAVSVSVDVNDMAMRMLQADLAIGAGGATTWERCCLGLPALIVVTAENQLAATNILHDEGAILNLGYFADLNRASFIAGVAQITRPAVWKSISDKSLAITDGLGCRLVQDAIGGL